MRFSQKNFTVSAIQAITITRPSCPRTFVFGAGSEGKEALSCTLRKALGRGVKISWVSEVGCLACEDGNMAIILVGENHTVTDLRRAREIASRLKAKGLLVSIIIATSNDQPSCPPGFACDGWISALGTKGVTDTAIAILDSLYSQGLIAFDFADLRRVLEHGGAGQATTIEVPFTQNFPGIIQVLKGAKRALAVITMNAEGTLSQKDQIATHCRRYLSKGADFTFTDVFKKECIIPSLTVIGI